MEKAYLTTKDGIKIVADVYEKSDATGWLVLVHMMPAVKESWRDFALEAQKSGYEIIAIDLRGHGESDGGPDGFLQFSDKQHQESILDLEAAVNYLKEEKNAIEEKIYFIGASIGANLALQYIVNSSAGESKFKKVILLSAGLNYRGIETAALVERLKSDQGVLFVAAKDDERFGGNNVEINKKLFELAPSNIKKEIEIYETGGHGTDIIRSHPELKGSIINFLSN